MFIDISELISSYVRPVDTVARLRGDEFSILMVNCSQHEALRKAEEIRSAVHDHDFHSNGEVFRIGVSIGLVFLDGKNVDLIERSTVRPNSAIQITAYAQSLYP